jgi:nucleoside-diphosphate-sugar epimerase
MKSTKILVTGGAGYVGSTMLPMLLDRGFEVTVYDKLLYGGNALLPYFRNKNFIFEKGDTRDKAHLAKVLKNKDVVIHLAAIVGFPLCEENPELARAVNVGGAKNLAELLSKDQYLLNASTGSNYGAVPDGICTEETPLNPLSVYGVTKTEAELLLLEKANCTAYRFATAFGISPRMRLDLLINDLTYQAMKNKFLVIYESSFMRTFIDVSDMGRAFIFAIDNYEKMKGNVYNAGDESMNYSKKQICEMIAKETGAQIHFAEIGEDMDKRNYVVSYKKINALGYRTTVTVEEGIKELVRALPTIKITNQYSNI